MNAKRLIAGIGIGAGVVGVGLVATGAIVGGCAAMMLTPKDGPTMRRDVADKMRDGGEKVAEAGRSVGRKVGSIAGVGSAAG